MKRTTPLLLSCALLAVGPRVGLGQIPAQLLFRDTFDVSAGSTDVNYQYNAGRQSGSAAPIQYSDSSVLETLTQVGVAEAPGQLLLRADWLENFVSVSPRASFDQAGPFTIEFDLDAGIDDPGGTSGDWAAIVFGASRPNVFVNASDGMGILFRNNGPIQVFDGGTSVYGGDGAIPGGIPLGQIGVRIEVDVADFYGGSPATVRLFINDVQAKINAGETLEYVKASGFRGNFITLEGSAYNNSSWGHAFDNFSVTGIPGVQVGARSVAVERGATSAPVSVTIPAGLNATQAAQVVVSTLDPTVAVPTGAAPDGTLVLEFAAGGARTQSFTIDGAGAGGTFVRATSAQGLSVNRQVAALVASGAATQELLFEDTFETSMEEWDVNAGIDLGRQSGSVTPVAYTESADSAAGGLYDDYTVVNPDIYPGALYLFGYSVSPNYSFTDGGAFTIEFQVDPGFSNQFYDQADWAAIVFGASQPLRFVNASDGIGILFRNDRRIQVFDGAAVVWETGFDDLLPIPPLDVRIEVETAGFLGTSPTVVRLFVNDQAIPLSGAGAEYVKTTGLLGNYITLTGYGVELEHAFDTLRVSAESCARADATNLVFLPGDTSRAITVRIPEGANAAQAVTVTLTSRNPAVATLTGAQAGVLTLTFPAGGATAQQVTVEALGKGQTAIDLAVDGGLCNGDPIAITIYSSLVRNPSFEDNPPSDAYPHYGPINSWAGGSGINLVAGPFHDNGIIPDRSQVAFLQGGASISQMLYGLEPGEGYWLQFFYNTRNCCGERMLDITALFDAQELVTVPNVQPAGLEPYHFQNVEFAPGSNTGLLEFFNTVSGDATSLLDAVTIVKRGQDELIVANPSFEASGTPPWPGYVNPAPMAGWTGTGGYGVNLSGSGPFADNGVNPDQDNVAFLQGTASLSQSFSSFVAGNTYTLEFACNARAGNSPQLVVTLDAQVLLDEVLAPVGAGQPYLTRTIQFVAPEPQGTLTFTQTAAGDQTLLLDDVRIFGERSSIPCITAAPDALAVTIGQAGQVTVTVPQELLAQFSPASVTLASSDPAVVRLPGANAQGVVSLTFRQGESLSQTVAWEATGKGAARIDLANPHGVCFAPASVAVQVFSTFVRNPSFEDNPYTGWPGYGAIVAWTGTSNTGVNTSAGPFHDNGNIPDRGQVAFIQVSNSLYQTVGGLTPGQEYWLQFFYNARNCCGGTLDMQASFAGTPILQVPGVTAVGAGMDYSVGTAAFTPAGISGELRFTSIVNGDATLLVDAVTIVKKPADAVPVLNPSFEASGTPPWPGIIQPNRMAGWTATGSYGVNVSGAGPFADNGLNPDQDSVAFLQGTGSSMSQTINGLTAGQPYTLSYAYNARGGNAPRLVVTIDGQTAQDATVTPVGGAAPYLMRSFTFTPSAASAVLAFTQAAEGDHTVLIDDVVVKAGAGPVETELEIAPGTTSATVRVSWPEAAGLLTLQTAPAPGGAWSNVTQPAVVENGRFVVTVPVTGGAAFFRLTN